MWQAKSACYHLCSISKWNNASEWLKIIPWVDSNFTARFRSNNTLAVYMRSVMSLFLIPLVSGADVILIIYYLSVVSQIILVLDIPLVWLTYKNISCLYFRNFNNYIYSWIQIIVKGFFHYLQKSKFTLLRRNSMNLMHHLTPILKNWGRFKCSNTLPWLSAQV